MSNTNFKLVILDYAFKQINKPLATQVLNDLIVMKQSNFLRTDPSYVVMDKHDMIGTHFLIYETSDLYTPKLVFALRTTYEDRCLQHHLKTPFQELLPKVSKEIQNEYDKFHQKFPMSVDCNSWCVDIEYSKKNSGLRFSDIGYTMVYLHLYRMGLHHILGCTNEKYKASRWLENVGYFNKSFEFIHPVVPDKHLAIMIESFNKAHLSQVYLQNESLFKNVIEITSEQFSYQKILEVLPEAIIADPSVLNINKAA